MVFLSVSPLSLPLPLSLEQVVLQSTLQREVAFGFRQATDITRNNKRADYIFRENGFDLNMFMAECDKHWI